MKPLALLALIFLTAAPPRFELVQPELLSVGGSFTNAWADYDNDGDLDLFVGFGGRIANRLYRNDAGVLTDVAAAVGVADARGTLSVAWADHDADGDPDLLVGFAPGPTNCHPEQALRLGSGQATRVEGSAPPSCFILKLYRNDAAKHFVDVTRDAGIALDSGRVRQVAWIDYDADADLDLFVAFREKGNAMFRNDAGRFTDVANGIGLADTRRTVGAVWFDFDEDGDVDLLTGNMDGDANGMMRNEGGRFTDVAEYAGLAWGGRTPREATNGTVRPCVADVNNDGRLDVFMANYGRNGLFLNAGKGTFTDVSAAWGIDIDGRYDACAFADFDNDGRLDLYVNGTVTGGTSHKDYLFRNAGSFFTDVTPDNIKALEADHGAQWADFDRDGDEDLALTGVQPTGMHHLMRNMMPASTRAGFLRVSVVDSAGVASLAGAEVRLYAPSTNRVLGTRILDTGSGYNSQNAMPLHFGLGTQRMVDIAIVVPRNGNRRASSIRNVDTRAWAKCVAIVHVTSSGVARLAGKGCK